MISNIIAWHLDLKLSKFCKKKKLKYSRYADDITISGSRILPRYKTIIFQIIEKEGFKINFDKLRLLDRGSCQKVTGLVVNEKVSIGRKRKKLYRAIVHNILKNGPIFENRECNPFFKEKIFGTISFIKSVDSEFGNYLYQQIEDINWADFEHKDSYTYSLDSRLEKETTNLIDFMDLTIFKEIYLLKDVTWDDELLKRLSNLKEKCSKQSLECCRTCLFKNSPFFEDCIKYILSHFTLNTGGPHHGHELCDILVNTKFKETPVYVAFIIKSGNLTGNTKNSLINQIVDVTDVSTLDIIAIVTNTSINSKTLLKIVRIVKKCAEDKFLILIQDKELGQILFTYIQNKKNV